MLRYVSVHTSIYTDVRYFYAQDTVVIVPPYPYCIEEDRHDHDMMSPWKTVGLHVPSFFQVLFVS